MAKRSYKIVLILLSILIVAFLSQLIFRTYAKQNEQERLIAEQEADQTQLIAQENVEANIVEEEPAELSEEELIKEKIRNGDIDDLKVVFLTFDDGPDEYSDVILDTLADNDVKATFFTNGHTEEEYQHVYKRIVNEGHVLANHTYSHSYANYKNPENFFADIERLNEYQTALTGEEPSYVLRFPGGSNISSLACVNGVVERGYSYFDWNVDFNDGLSDTITKQQAYDSMITQIHKNRISVVLSHAERPTKAGGREALDDVIKTLKSEGYTFLTLDNSLNLYRFLDSTV